MATDLVDYERQHASAAGTARIDRGAVAAARHHAILELRGIAQHVLQAHAAQDQQHDKN